MPSRDRRTSPCSLCGCFRTPFKATQQHDAPGTVHLPFFIMVSTALTTSGRACAISSTYGKAFEYSLDDFEGLTHREVLEWSGLLDIGQCCLEVLELFVNLLRGLLRLGNLFKTHALDSKSTPGSKGTTNSFALERVDSLQVGVHIVGNGLVAGQNFLGLINDGLVLEDCSVLCKIYGGRCIAVLVVNALSFRVTLAESL